MKRLLLISGLLSTVILANCAVADSTTSSTTDTTTTTTTTGTPCVSNPTHDAALTDSTSVSVSHNFGQDCMNGCHNPVGGTTQTRWTVAGSMADGFFSTTKALTGTISNIGVNLLSLPVDTCGNFYTTADPGIITGSNPSASTNMGNGDWNVKTPTNPGSCNESGCHDNTSYTRIY